ncbi:MAG TPA: FAD-binding protein [Acidimicrobiales bacterium]|nr:FAD-binding protein [Acidimicrobiales bacterium]
MTGEALAAFAAEVGGTGPVAVAGGRTQWEVGGRCDPSARMVRAPGGVVEHRPAEMTVRVRAGTPVGQLDAALADAGQMVPLDPVRPLEATVGGVLAVGRSGVRRLRYGPVRDCVLEVRYVSAAGELVKAGAPVVKNVSGFDLVRLMVGSLGTLGLVAEVVLRTHPRPAASAWLTADADGGAVERAAAALFRPSSLLWDGARAWALLEGHPSDVDAEAAALGRAWQECAGPPVLPTGARVSLDPTAVLAWAAERPSGSFVAELGVGVVHLVDGGAVPPSPPPAGPVLDLNQRVKAAFDPEGRLNPGRTPVP